MSRATYSGPEDFQGKEFTATLQAPTLEVLDKMLESLNEYATEFSMEEIEVLQKGPDPDGGWKAVVVAHNFNPLAWLHERWQARAGGPEAREKVAEKRGEVAQEMRFARLAARRRAKLARLAAKERLGTVRLGARERGTAELIEEEERLRKAEALRQLHPADVPVEGTITKFIFS